MSFWEQSDIDKLKAAIASGTLTVRYDGPPARSVTYQNLGQMRELLAEMRADVSGKSRTKVASHSKGF
jgi:hypothetical protein